MKNNLFNKFYTKTIQERLNILDQAEIISAADYHLLTSHSTKLPTEVANRMIENYILKDDANGIMRNSVEKKDVQARL